MKTLTKTTTLKSAKGDITFMSFRNEESDFYRGIIKGAGGWYVDLGNGDYDWNAHKNGKALTFENALDYVYSIA